MPKVTASIKTLVTLDIPEKLARKITRDDLEEMVTSGFPDSSSHPGPPNGTQVIIEGKAQEDEEGGPVFADVFSEHDCTNDIEFEDWDDGFDKANP